MLREDAAADDLALRIHTDACLRARFRSKPISRSGGLGPCLASYAGPTLLIWGEHDVTAEPAQAALALCQGRADRHSRIVPGAGHWVQFERADAVNALLREWLPVDHSWFRSGGRASKIENGGW
jgi:pimeloyl-ACP methyl ester carboxylesterase